MGLFSISWKDLERSTSSPIALVVEVVVAAAPAILPGLTISKSRGANLVEHVDGDRAVAVLSRVEERVPGDVVIADQVVAILGDAPGVMNWLEDEVA